jgi:diguanylate cyclase (GGDEF)-like protein
MKHPECPHDHADCLLPADLERLRRERESLRKLVSVDELTGLYNFRFLQDALESEMERTRRTGLSTGLIMVDLDHFKRVNDTYGHQNGNRALKAAADTWKTHLRKIDIPCRYGGEEFVIILPNTKIHDAIRAAERLRRELAATPVDLDAGQIRLTASFGVDEFREGESLAAQAFIHRVDQFVLAAKKEGRNQVCYDQARVARPVTEVTAAERESLFLKRKP